MEGIFPYKNKFHCCILTNVHVYSEAQTGSNYSMENNVTSQISGSFTSDCVKIMVLKAPWSGKRANNGTKVRKAKSRRKGVAELGDRYTFDVTDLPSNNVIVNVIEKSTGHLNCPKSTSMDI